MKMNGSYIVKFKIFTKPYYLFSDGTAGLLAKHPGKTAIGVVVYRARQLAMALNDVDAGATYQWSSLMPGAENNNDDRFSTSLPNTVNYVSAGGEWNSQPYAYALTYDQFTTPSTNKVKGNSTDYPAFYAAAHYTPSVPVTGANLDHWVLPTVDEWGELLRHYGKNFGNSLPAQYRFQSWTDQVDYSSSSIASLFTPVSGTVPSGTYWTSREYMNTSGGTPKYEGVSFTFGIIARVSIANDDKIVPKKVRPFIYY